VAWGAESLQIRRFRRVARISARADDASLCAHFAFGSEAPQRLVEGWRAV
jgi:hypothetical protein